MNSCSRKLVGFLDCNKNSVILRARKMVHYPLLWCLYPRARKVVSCPPLWSEFGLFSCKKGDRLSSTVVKFGVFSCRKGDKSFSIVVRIRCILVQVW